MPADQSNLFISGSTLYLTGFEGELFDEVDFSTDMTSVTITAAGTTVLMKADGSTPKATLTTFDGGPVSGWSVTCNASNSSPIQIKDVLSADASYDTISIEIDPVWSKEPNWDTDRWFLEIIYNGFSLPSSHSSLYDACRVGVVPSGSAAVPWDEDGSRLIVYAKAAGGSTFQNGWWRNEYWGTTDSDVLLSDNAGPVMSSSQSVVFDSYRGRMATKLGATDYISGSLLPNGDWNFDAVGKRAVTVSLTGAGDYTNGPAIFLRGGTQRTSGDKVDLGIKKVRLYVAVPNSRTQAQ